MSEEMELAKRLRKDADWLMTGGQLASAVLSVEVAEAIERLTEDRDKWRLQARYETDVAAAEIEGRKAAEARVAKLREALREIDLSPKSSEWKSARAFTALAEDARVAPDPCQPSEDD